jgi:hypothetical protein
MVAKSERAVASSSRVTSIVSLASVTSLTPAVGS